MTKIKEELLSTDLAAWRKKAMFIAIVFMSIFPFFITYKASSTNLEVNLFQLRYFIGIAATQAIAQISLAWYVMKNKVPMFVILSLFVMAMFFQVTYGIAVILVSNA